MKVLTIKAFSFGSEEPIAKKMAVVEDPDAITLRAFIDEKIKQAVPSFSFSAVDHIAQVVTTSDQTDIVDLLDFPVSLLLEQLESRPEIAVTINNAAAPSSDDSVAESTEGEIRISNNHGNVEPENESKGGSNGEATESTEGGSSKESHDLESNAELEPNVPPEGDEPLDMHDYDPEGDVPLDMHNDDPEGDEPLDALGQLVAIALAEWATNPQEPIKFDPVSITPLLPVTVGGENIMDRVSAMTILEPEVPDGSYEQYHESSDLETLRDLVNDLANAGDDEGAIEMVTAELVRDNDLSISFEVPLFCLTTLWVLARKSYENKRKIIFGGATLEAIVEAMDIYRDTSAEIQTRACGLLWALSMEAKDRVHVAQSGACKAILKAMVAHVDDAALQAMALGCLKALSSSSHSKANMSLKRSSSVVADVMRKHVYDPVVQSEGCVVLGNLAASDADQFVHAVTEKEISAVVNGVLANPDELDVHEAACFTLMRLASSAANVELIRGNGLSPVSLQQAFEKNPDGVGNNIHILLRRLKFDTPAIQE